MIDKLTALIRENEKNLEEMKSIVARLAASSPPAIEMVEIPAPPDGFYNPINMENSATFRIPSFSMSKYPVTQAQWKAVMGDNPSYFKGDQRPVEMVSLEDAVHFCEKLSHYFPDQPPYRLPTEWEWEWGASGGVKEDREITDLTGWHSKNSHRITHPVGEKAPNSFGLYDTLGNVWEWTSSKWNEEKGVIRGGSWSSGPAYTRVSFRGKTAPSYRWNYLGFRLARSSREVG